MNFLNDVSVKGSTIKSPKKYASVVVGHAESGHTLADCDYLCDGTDDQNEIKTAANGLPDFGEVILLEGTYKLTAPIDIYKSNITIRGMGVGTEVKSYGVTNFSLIKTNTYTDVTISDIQLQGGMSSNNIYGIHVEASTDPRNIKIHNVSFINLLYGVYIYKTSSAGINAMGCIVTENIFNMCKYGVYIGGASPNGNVISNNVFRNIETTAITISSGIENVISNNAIHFSTVVTTGTGISLVGACSFNTVSGNVIKNAVKGLWGLTNGYTLTCNVVVGNIISRGTGLTTDYTSTQYSIFLDGSTATNNLITGNMLKGKDAVYTAGVGNILANNMI